MANHWHQTLHIWAKNVTSRIVKKRKGAEFQVESVLMLATLTPRTCHKAINQLIVVGVGFWCAPATMIVNIRHVIAALGSPWIPLEPSAAPMKSSRLAKKRPPRTENLWNFSSISIPVLSQSDNVERLQWSPWEMSLISPCRSKIHPSGQKKKKAYTIFICICLHNCPYQNRPHSTTK